MYIHSSRLFIYLIYFYFFVCKIGGDCLTSARGAKRKLLINSELTVNTIRLYPIRYSEHPYLFSNLSIIDTLPLLVPTRHKFKTKTTHLNRWLDNTANKNQNVDLTLLNNTEESALLQTLRLNSFLLSYLLLSLRGWFWNSYFMLTFVKPLNNFKMALWV